MMIQLTNITKSFHRKRVLHDVSLTIHENEFVVILGESGCGKTTLLRLLNGLTKKDSGRIVIENKEIEQWDAIKLRRKMGYVIQTGGLFPHMTVKHNIAYPLRMGGVAKKEREGAVHAVLPLVQLSDEILERYPHQLSGGQQQRVGIARALIRQPKVMLMDEPFGALDTITRKHLQKEIKQIHQQSNTTMVMVTHDIHEAMTLGSKVVILNRGVVEQDGSPGDIRQCPASDFVKQLTNG